MLVLLKMSTVLMILCALIAGCSDSPQDVQAKRANDPWIFIDDRWLVTSVNGDSGGNLYERRYYDKENKSCVRLVTHGRKGGLQDIPCPKSFTPPE